MKSTLKKSMAMVLVVLMALSCCAISSFAAVEDESFAVANLGTVSGITKRTNDVVYYNGYLYTTTPSKGLEVWDVTNRTAPVKTSFVDPAFDPENPTVTLCETDSKEVMLLWGSDLYVAYDGQTAKKYSLANPAQPVLQAILTNSASGYIWDFAKHANNLMATRNDGNSIQWENAITATATDGVPAEIAATTHGAVGAQYRLIPSTSTNVYYYYDSLRLGFRDRGEKGISGMRTAGISPAGYLYILADDALYAIKEEASNIGTRIDAATPIAIEGVDESKFNIEPKFYNNYMVFTAHDGEYLIFDITNPTAPVRVTGFDNYARTQMRNLAITPDGYIYALSMWMEPGVDYHTTLYVDKIVEDSVSLQRTATTFAPTALTDVNMGQNVRDFVIAGDYIYAGGTGSGLFTYNTQTGAKSATISRRLEPHGGTNMFLDGTTLYVALIHQNNENPGVLQAFNISNPANPTVVGYIGSALTVDETTGQPVLNSAYGVGYGFTRNGDYLVYSANYGARYIVLPVTGHTSIGNGSFDNLGGYQWMQSYYAEKRHSFVIDNNKAVLAAQRYNQTLDTTVSYSAHVNGEYLYVIQNNLLKVVDVSEIYDEETGNATAALYTANTVANVAIEGIDETKIKSAPVVYDNYLIYAADKLLVFDITNPAAPTRVNIADVTFTGTNSSMGLIGDTLYVTDATSTMRVIDLVQTTEVVSTEITSLPVTFAGTAAGASTVTLTVGRDSYTVPVVGGKWSKTITEVSDANGEIAVAVTTGYSTASANYTLNLPVPELAVNVSYTDTFNATVEIENNNENKQFMAILVVYNGNEIYDVDYEVISADATLSCVTPEGDVSGYTAETFVWSNLMVPFLTVPVAR